MPLVNSPALVPEKLAANRVKAQPSHGRITVEGLIRICDSKPTPPVFATRPSLRVSRSLRCLLRQEDSSFRQVGRLIDLLTKLKRDAWHAENKKNNNENEGESHDIIENKGSNFLSHDVHENKGS